MSIVPVFLLLFIYCIVGEVEEETSHFDKGNDPNFQFRETDRVTNLPGQPNVDFSQYSGYVTVNETHGRALFYWFFEASSDPASKPLVLWLNGGPGCSSVGYGAAQEIGPFRVNVNGTGLSLNKYSWNNETNLLFLESPAGVGFSYSNDSSDLENFGDKLTGEDAYAFLLRWFERFPEYKNRDFYIAGESYGGHYVPQLTELVYDRNKEPSKYPFFNLKGFIVGNAVTDEYHDWEGFVDYAWSHAVISDVVYHNVKNMCDFKLENWTDSCNQVINSIFDVYAKIDIYNLYSPICEEGGTGDEAQKTPQSKSRMVRGRLRDLRAGNDPCTERYPIIYFNRPDVQAALHANVTRIPYKWTVCSNVIFNSWKDSEFSILPIYKKLIEAGLRIWVYSGDIDGRVPVVGTRYCVNALQLPITAPWYPWFHNKQVGGWAQEYEGLMFVTVRGSGHMVPKDEPGRAAALFRAYLAGRHLPKTRT